MSHASGPLRSETPFLPLAPSPGASRNESLELPVSESLQMNRGATDGPVERRKQVEAGRSGSRLLFVSVGR